MPAAWGDSCNLMEPSLIAGTAMNEIIRLPEILQITSVPTGTLYRWMKEGSFPRQVKLGPRAVGWYRSEVTAWIENRSRTGPRNAA
jgi:prophage regulatory protein